MVDDLADGVGQGLVQRPALVQGEQAGGLLHVAVGELVADDVVRSRVAGAEHHLGAVPERVRIRALGVGEAPAHRGHQPLLARDRGADLVGEVDPVEIGVDVGGGAQVVVGGVDVGDR